MPTRTLSQVELAELLGGRTTNDEPWSSLSQTWGHPDLRLSVERHDRRGVSMARAAISTSGILLVGFADVGSTRCWAHRSPMATGRLVAQVIGLGAPSVRMPATPPEQDGTDGPIALTTLLNRCRSALAHAGYLIQIWYGDAWRPMTCLECCEEGDQATWSVVSPVEDWRHVTVAPAGSGAAWLQLCRLSDLATTLEDPRLPA